MTAAAATGLLMEPAQLVGLISFIWYIFLNLAPVLDPSTRVLTSFVYVVFSSLLSFTCMTFLCVFLTETDTLLVYSLGAFQNKRSSCKYNFVRIQDCLNKLTNLQNAGMRKYPISLGCISLAAQQTGRFLW